MRFVLLALLLALPGAALPQAAPPSPGRDAGAAAAPPKSPLSGDDERYFRELAQASLGKVHAGKLAEQKAQSQKVRDLARDMVEEHSKLLKEQSAMATARGEEVPKEPSAEQKAAMKQMQETRGEAFDRLFTGTMVAEHEKALRIAREAAQKAKDPQVKALARKAAPEIEKHLQMARTLSDRAAAGGTPR